MLRCTCVITYYGGPRLCPPHRHSKNLINSISIQCVIIIPADLHSLGRKGLVWGVVRVGEVVANI